MNPENTNRDVASQPPQLNVNHWVLKFRLSRDILTLPPWRAPVINGHFSFIGSNHGPSYKQTLRLNLPYEDTSLQGALYLVPGVSAYRGLNQVLFFINFISASILYG